MGGMVLTFILLFSVLFWFMSFNAVESFNVEELANMAESLVSITNLQRHITSSEETVGGPVDVAVITRCEGFIWVKRKMWFDSELNKHIVRDNL